MSTVSKAYSVNSPKAFITLQVVLLAIKELYESEPRKVFKSGDIRAYLGMPAQINISSFFYRARKLGLMEEKVEFPINKRDGLFLVDDKAIEYIHINDGMELTKKKLDYIRNNPEETRKAHFEKREYRKSCLAKGKTSGADLDKEDIPISAEEAAEKNAHAKTIHPFIVGETPRQRKYRLTNIRRKEKNAKKGKKQPKNTPQVSAQQQQLNEQTESTLNATEQGAVNYVSQVIEQNNRRGRLLKQIKLMIDAELEELELL